MARVEHDHSAAQWNALKAAWGGWPTAARPTGHCSATVEVLEGAATVPTTIAVSDGAADEVVTACLAAAGGTRVGSESRLLESDSDPG